MKDIGIDFGLLIAYLVPGVISLKGLAFGDSGLQRLFADSYGNSNALAAIAALIALSIVAGMIISVVRASTIDHTFAMSLQNTFLKRIPRVEAGAFYGATRRQEPQYAKLAEGNRLPAFLEAKISEKRPYQFYGNTIIALLIYVVALGLVTASKDAQASETGFLWRFIIILISVFFLYIAARQSHHRFMKAVDEFNQLK
jgi:flagellar biosynthesis protein FliQ